MQIPMAVTEVEVIHREGKPNTYRYHQSIIDRSCVVAVSSLPEWDDRDNPKPLPYVIVYFSYTNMLIKGKIMDWFPLLGVPENEADKTLDFEEFS